METTIRAIRKKPPSNRKMALSNWKRLPMQLGTTGRANMGDCRAISVCADSRMHSTTAGHTGREFWWTWCQLQRLHTYVDVEPSLVAKHNILQPATPIFAVVVSEKQSSQKCAQRRPQHHALLNSWQAEQGALFNDVFLLKCSSVK